MGFGGRWGDEGWVECYLVLVMGWGEGCHHVANTKYYRCKYQILPLQGRGNQLD